MFARGTDLHEHKLYKSGAIILQDKVSMSHLQRNLMKCVSVLLEIVHLWSGIFDIYIAVLSTTDDDHL